MFTEQEEKLWKAMRKKEQWHDSIIIVPTMTAVSWPATWILLEIIADLSGTPFNSTAFRILSGIAVAIFVLYPLYAWKKERDIDRFFLAEIEASQHGDEEPRP